MKTTFVGIAVPAVLALMPSSATAATCSEYGTQAEAQRAATRATLTATGSTALSPPAEGALPA